MCLSLLHDVRFHDFLLEIDEDLKRRAHDAGCPRCGRRLDNAPFSRKPRGGPPGLGEKHCRRLSLCCDACRKRVTPPSVRFYGRRVYWAGAFVLACAKKLTPGWLRRLTEVLGVDRRTVRRWRRWWQETFLRSAWWKTQRGRLIPPVVETDLPGSLLDRFPGEGRTSLVALLEWLAPAASRAR